ncbi:hypothetical protein NEHOM01_0298 [Nematocida homosporus]|uniref:uncharacterized protein n=1 Tax=Nematocida homosporus TaxID=1912981 RepID=UPI00221FC2E9|nr:uncharacterized protein NEHOM01_0298 [Nematocida homosporus]KAI5184623.1 hypothetical protein NEHOM01_0298 [Nematocida homosporus]
MAICQLTLVFPFRVSSREHRAQISTSLLRKENVVTFAIPLNALVTVEAIHPYTVHYSSVAEPTHRAICISFKSINDAIAFEKNPEAHLSQAPADDLLSLDEELDRIASEIEKTHEYWKKKKRGQSFDDEGYQKV